MPPVGFWASASSSYDTVSGNMTLLVPTTAREQDVLLMVLVVPAADSFDFPDGWDVTAGGGSAAISIYLLRHVVVDGDPVQITMLHTAALTPQPLALLLQYRSLDLIAPIVAHQLTNVAVAGTAFVAPSIALSAYSDLDLALYYALDAAGTATFTLPPNVKQRGTTLHGPGGLGGGTLVVGEYLQEAVGATPTLTGTCSSAQTGFAAQFAFKALPTIVAPSLVPDVPGAIGLPTVGV